MKLFHILIYTLLIQLFVSYKHLKSNKLLISKEEPTNTTDNATAINDTKTNNESLEVEIISSPPYNIEKPNQMIYYEGTTLSNHSDYTTYKTPAFFTMSILSVNMFEKKDSHILNESISFQSILEEPYILLGSTKCIIFKDYNSERNITLCAKDANDAELLINAYKSIRKLYGTQDNQNNYNKHISKVSCNKITDRNGKAYDYVEIQNILKQKLNDNGIPNIQASIDSEGFANIKDIKDRIKYSKYMVPGTEPEFEENTWNVGKYIKDSDFNSNPLFNNNTNQ